MEVPWNYIWAALVINFLLVYLVPRRLCGHEGIPRLDLPPLSPDDMDHVGGWGKYEGKGGGLIFNKPSINRMRADKNETIQFP